MKKANTKFDKLTDVPPEIKVWPKLSGLTEINSIDSRQMSHARRHLAYQLKLNFDDLSLSHILEEYRLSKYHIKDPLYVFVSFHKNFISYGRKL